MKVERNGPRVANAPAAETAQRKINAPAAGSPSGGMDSDVSQELKSRRIHESEKKQDRCKSGIHYHILAGFFRGRTRMVG